MNVDDRAVSILENYEFKVLRTWKGRGAILCETNQGIKIIKEYIGPKDKIALQNEFLCHIKKQGFKQVEQIVKNKEEELLTCDSEQTSYLVKDYFDGKECNVKEETECVLAMSKLAKMHQVSQMSDHELLCEAVPFSLEKEYEKHNKELKKVRNYVRQKSQKTDFEIHLMKYYDHFYDSALQVEEELKSISWEEFYKNIKKEGNLCHGDFQYHNILLSDKGAAVINFEKYVLDSRVRDVYLFMRKVLEKNNWSENLGNKLLESYEKEYPFTQEEKKQLYYRFLYPEKFWKIVNFYFNSGKSFISIRNMEKLEKVLKSQEDMQKFIFSLKSMIK